MVSVLDSHILKKAVPLLFGRIAVRLDEIEPGLEIGRRRSREKEVVPDHGAGHGQRVALDVDVDVDSRPLWTPKYEGDQVLNVFGSKHHIDREPLCRDVIGLPPDVSPVGWRHLQCRITESRFNDTKGQGQPHLQSAISPPLSHGIFQVP